MFRALLITALLLPAAALARPSNGQIKKTDRAPAARRAQAPARSRIKVQQAPARSRSVVRKPDAQPSRARDHRPGDARRARDHNRRGRVESRVVVAPSGRGGRARAPRARAPHRRDHRRYRASRHHRSHYYYGSRPRWRPVVVVIDHDLVYGRLAHAERRMSRLEQRAAQIESWRERRSLEHDAADMRSDLAGLDHDANRIRSWYHWERSLDRIRALRHRLSAVDADIAAGPVRRAPAPRPVVGRAMSEKTFARFDYQLEAATFRADKLRVVRQIARDHWVTSAQARAIAARIHFNDDRVAALEILYPRVVDPENYDVVFNTLPFSSDRAALELAIYRD